MLYSFDFMIPFSFNMDFLSVLVLPLKMKHGDTVKPPVFKFWLEKDTHWHFQN